MFVSETSEKKTGARLDRGFGICFLTFLKQSVALVFFFLKHPVLILRGEASTYSSYRRGTSGAQRGGPIAASAHPAAGGTIGSVHPRAGDRECSCRDRGTTDVHSAGGGPPAFVLRAGDHLCMTQHPGDHLCLYRARGAATSHSRPGDRRMFFVPQIEGDRKMIPPRTGGHRKMLLPQT